MLDNAASDRAVNSEACDAREESKVVEKAKAAPVRRRKLDRRVPPPSLLGAGVYVVLQALGVVSVWAMYWFDGGGIAAGIERGDLIGASVTPVVQVVALLLTLAHMRAARVVLLGSATAGAVFALVQLVEGDASVQSAVLAFLSVLVVLAVSGDDARIWTEPARTPRFGGEVVAGS